jgi:hypothetical protein
VARGRAPKRQVAGALQRLQVNNRISGHSKYGDADERRYTQILLEIDLR